MHVVSFKILNSPFINPCSMTGTLHEIKAGVQIPHPLSSWFPPEVEMHCGLKIWGTLHQSPLIRFHARKTWKRFVCISRGHKRLPFKAWIQTVMCSIALFPEYWNIRCFSSLKWLWFVLPFVGKVSRFSVHLFTRRLYNLSQAIRTVWSVYSVARPH